MWQYKKGGISTFQALKMKLEKLMKFVKACTSFWFFNNK